MTTKNKTGQLKNAGRQILVGLGSLDEQIGSIQLVDEQLDRSYLQLIFDVDVHWQKEDLQFRFVQIRVHFHAQSIAESDRRRFAFRVLKTNEVIEKVRGDLFRWKLREGDER